MNVTVEECDAAQVVRVAGEVDMHNAPQLRKVLMELVDGEAPVIIVSLSGAQYIATAGIATLVECLQKVALYNGKFRLAEIQKEMLDIFKLAKLDGIFDIFDTEWAAMEACS